MVKIFFFKLCAEGLKQSYTRIEKDIQRWFKSLFCLAFIPAFNVELQFQLFDENEMRYVLSRKPYYKIKRQRFC